MGQRQNHTIKRASHGTRRMLRCPPRTATPKGAAQGGKGTLGLHHSFSIGMQHRTPSSLKPINNLNQQPTKHARDAVAARAGNRHAHTRESPLTRRLRSQYPNAQVINYSRQCNRAQTTTINEQARPSKPRMARKLTKGKILQQLRDGIPRWRGTSTKG